MQDLAKDRAPHYKKSRRFFDGLAMQLVQQQHSLDVFACALDQARTPLQRTCVPLAESAISLCSAGAQLWQKALQYVFSLITYMLASSRYLAL